MVIRNQHKLEIIRAVFVEIEEDGLVVRKGTIRRRVDNFRLAWLRQCKQTHSGCARCECVHFELLVK
jgi:hypothetical protein